MALGGGTFTSQNKILPGAYINFISTASANAALSERGVAAMAFVLDWGAENTVSEVTVDDFIRHSQKIFGYDYAHEKLKGLRDLFKNIKTLYAYRLNSDGEKASNDFAEALYGGVRGNDLKVIIKTNIDDESKKDVELRLSGELVYSKTVSTAAELEVNEFVVWKESAALTPTAGTPLSGGTNGAEITAAAHQAFCSKIEAYSFNALGVVSETLAINEYYAAFCKRMRDDYGVKFQTVVYNCPADYEGVVNLKNATKDAGWTPASLVYWATGIVAGCAVHESNSNKIYNGEFDVSVDYTQAQLVDAINSGEFILHQVGSEKRVLKDINSLVTTTVAKGDVFKNNKTIRVADEIGNYIAGLFNSKYYGNIPNDAAGRISLWTDIIKHLQQLVDMRAIAGFEDDDIIIELGNKGDEVIIDSAVTMTGDMGKLYMTCKVA